MNKTAATDPSPSRVSQPIGNGVFVAVVGPSGAGKDTVIEHARSHLADSSIIEFARRVITRPCDGQSEQHDSMTDDEFETAEKQGAFALAWKAHGLRYGIPASADAAIRDGRVVIANASRNEIARMRRRYAMLIVAEITAEPEVLAERLAARGRESRAEVLARLARSKPGDLGPSVFRIDNSGTPDAAGDAFLRLVLQAAEHASRPTVRKKGK
ncbi:phosphonate metabolism protein/1,5-bisphosphokinase (PRPP-forming) PhnN [Corticibacterium sp. UT-5YL-CI-8]|nr:phosphonate metabolism protein/1,5-bisphosphokinase (PRPP-forming) PhnN [Tianweitania sp. UT-5YL-CI-8]